MKDPAINIWMKAIRKQLEDKGANVRNIRLQAFWDCEKTGEARWVAIMSITSNPPFVTESYETTEGAMEHLGKMAGEWNPDRIFRFKKRGYVAPFTRLYAILTGGEPILLESKESAYKTVAYVNANGELYAPVYIFPAAGKAYLNNDGTVRDHYTKSWAYI